jgi:hypothetical protein
LDKAGCTTRPSSKKSSANASRSLPEDELLIEMKEKRGLPRSEIAKNFPGKTKVSLQVRYRTKPTDRGTWGLRRDQ